MRAQRTPPAVMTHACIRAQYQYKVHAAYDDTSKQAKLNQASA